MHPATRPSAILALTVSLASTSGCLVWGSCGDEEVERHDVSVRLPLEEDGTVAVYDGTVDPATQEGCEALCRDHAYLEVTEIRSCDASFLGIEDTGAEDTSAEPQVQIDCVVKGIEVCIGGRYSAVLQARASGRGADPVAAWLAREACGEAGSVIAFRRLARELEALGAPASLVARARSAMRDEVVHARMVGDLARSRGGSPDRVAEAPLPLRSLAELALENAVEGCVHETFAAARAAWQASYASDPSVRSLSAVLAADEAAHADLAADVHAWACSVLPPRDAQRVEAARRAAWAQLANNPAPVDPASARALGLPDATAHRRIVGALIEALAA